MGGLRCQPLLLHTASEWTIAQRKGTADTINYGMVDARAPNDGAGEALRKLGSAAGLYISALGQGALWPKT